MHGDNRLINPRGAGHLIPRLDYRLQEFRVPGSHMGVRGYRSNRMTTGATGLQGPTGPNWRSMGLQGLGQTMQPFGTGTTGQLDRLVHQGYRGHRPLQEQSTRPTGPLVCKEFRASPGALELLGNWSSGIQVSLEQTGATSPHLKVFRVLLELPGPVLRAQCRLLPVQPPTGATDRLDLTGATGPQGI